MKATASQRRNVIGPWGVVGVILATFLLACGAQGAPVRSGSGFFISAHGELLTNFHVASNCKSLSVWPPGQPMRKAHIIGLDRDTDLALLGSPESPQRFGRISSIMAAKPGTPVHIIGYGADQIRPRSANVSHGYILEGTSDNTLHIAAHLVPGNSGGPVIDKTGHIVGIIFGRVAKNPMISLARSAERIRGFLASHHVNITQDDTTTNGINLISELLNISALIQCVPNTPMRQSPRRNNSKK